MMRIPVQSSNVKTVGFEPGSRLLEVEFVSGGVYRYKDVPVETSKRLMQAPSVGAFVQREIKPTYVCEKVS